MYWHASDRVTDALPTSSTFLFQLQASTVQNAINNDKNNNELKALFYLAF